MWQRWNQSSHIFEKSTDNGASWTPLGLSADIITEGTLSDARLSSNVALKNIDNNFSIGQTVPELLMSSASPTLTYYENTQPSGGKRWRSTAYAQVLSLQTMPDDGSSATTLQWVNRSGGMAVAGAMVLGSLTIPTMSPGDLCLSRGGSATAGAIYFGSDISAYLYRESTSVLAFGANQSLTIANGNLKLANATNGVVYERARSAFMGQPLVWTPVFYTDAGSPIGGSVAAYYSLLGQQLFFSVYLTNFSNPAAVAYLRCTLPVATTVPTYCQGACRNYVPGIGDRAGYWAVGVPDANWIAFYRADGGNWPTGAGHIAASGSYWIA